MSLQNPEGYQPTSGGTVASSRGRVLAIANQKGGVGKTTTAVTLADGLARRLVGTGYVLLVDLDPQGNAAPCLGVSPNGHDIAYLLAGEKAAEDCIVQAGTRSNLYVLPASDQLADVKIELIGREITSGLTARKRNGSVSVNHILSDKLSIAAGAFDYIVIDCPPSLDMLANAVFDFADAAIVPVKPDFLGTTGTAHHTQNILDAQADGIDIHVALYVPTFFRSREVLANQMLASLTKVYGRTRVADPIPQAAALEQAPAAGGQTIFEYAPDSPPALAYAKLVERVMKL